MYIVGPDESEVTHEQILAFQALRKDTFVDDLNWDLCTYGRHEFDQYDMPAARYVIAFEQGACVGGARLAQCDLDFKSVDGRTYTYMLNDFCHGTMAGNFPVSHLSRALPRSSDSWELTRFIAKSRSITEKILVKADEYLVARGAKEVLTLSPVLMPRILKNLGFECSVVSDPVEYDGRQYVVISTKVGSTSPRIPVQKFG